MRRLRRKPASSSDSPQSQRTSWGKGDSAAHVIQLLEETRARLDTIATTSGAAADGIRERALHGDTEGDGEGSQALTLDLMRTLADRLDAIQEEVVRLAAVLGRTRGGLAQASGRAEESPASSSPGGGHGTPDEPDGPVQIEQVTNLAKCMADAGASRQEIAAWVFREHGVVLSGQMVEEVVQGTGRSQ
jgi:hypothetical protein